MLFILYTKYEIPVLWGLKSCSNIFLQRSQTKENNFVPILSILPSHRQHWKKKIMFLRLVWMFIVQSWSAVWEGLSVAGRVTSKAGANSLHSTNQLILWKTRSSNSIVSQMQISPIFLKSYCRLVSSLEGGSDLNNPLWICKVGLLLKDIKGRACSSSLLVCWGRRHTDQAEAELMLGCLMPRGHILLGGSKGQIESFQQKNQLQWQC